MPWGTGFRLSLVPIRRAFRIVAANQSGLDSPPPCTDVDHPAKALTMRHSLAIIRSFVVFWLALSIGFSVCAADDEHARGIAQQIDRLSVLIADPEMKTELKSERIVQPLSIGQAHYVAVVLAYGALGGTGYAQTLALFIESPVERGRFTLQAWLDEAGSKGDRTIVRVLPVIYPASGKARRPSFWVEAIDENSESSLRGKRVKVRFEFDAQLLVPVGAPEQMLTK